MADVDMPDAGPLAGSSSSAAKAKVPVKAAKSGGEIPEGKKKFEVKKVRSVHVTAQHHII
jgi:hypothetical protein